MNFIQSSLPKQFHTFTFYFILKTRFIIAFFFVVFSLTLKAQQPSHYIIGAEELAGIDIYSIAQDKNGAIWLSTNSGLLQYDGYNYKKIESVKAKTNSLFGLKKDNNGNLFCCNLNGQIFTIQNDSLVLFYEIPGSLLSNFTYFNFDNKNQLIICTDNYYLVKPGVETRFLYPSSYPSQPIAKTNQNELVFMHRKAQQVAYFKNDEVLKKEKIDFDADYPSNTKNNLFLTRNQLPYIYQYTKSGWNKIEFEQKDKLENNSFDFYPINDSILCLANIKNGVSIFCTNGTLKYQQTDLFSRYRISCFLNDRESNLWLPTLGKGIIIIPNTEIIDYNNHTMLGKDDVKAITSDNDGNIYVAGLNGIIYQIKNQEVRIIKQENKKIEYINFIPLNNNLFYNNKIITAEGSKQKKMSIPYAKDISEIDSANYLIATNKGVHTISFNENESQNTRTNQLTTIRTSCVAYNKKGKEIWAGTSKGLQVIYNKESTFLLINQQQIIALDIEIIDDEVWVATAKNGILIFKDREFSHSFQFTKDSNLKNITHLKYKNNSLYFTSKNGFHTYNFSKKMVKTISKTDGLLSNNILDFDIVDDIVWLVLPNGIQSINQNKIFENNIIPTIKWAAIKVNNKVSAERSSNEFSYNQNQFEFHFIAKAFRHQGKLTYHYQLEGLNEVWKETSSANNFAVYSWLPHGKYIFKVKAVNENGVASKTISYSFSVTPPFWLTWWFFSLNGALLIVIVASYFIIRLNIIKKRLTLEKQLKTSEITAIKAQMNPHFMFNALNSIQDLIMLKDIRNSNIYLGKFADLMRKVLEISSENTISLAEEIEILSLYLDLEKLRFGDEFTTKINHNFNNDKLMTLHIPTMLLQPYVENAIKHGLLHKKGPQELSINFSHKEGLLICEIIDNGVGRKKSKEINARREKSYPSFSTKANKKRIDLIRESTNKPISLEIFDLYKNDIAIGTKVRFEFS